MRGNSALLNTGFGLDLDDPLKADAVYRDNVVCDNAGGTVDRTDERGDNNCHNLYYSICSPARPSPPPIPGGRAEEAAADLRNAPTNYAKRASGGRLVRGRSSGRGS